MKSSTTRIAGRGSLCNKAAWLLVAFASIGAAADSVYKYRDGDGNWVFADKKPEGGERFERQARTKSRGGIPAVTVDRVSRGERVALVASNECFCPAEIGVWLTQASNVTSTQGDKVAVVVPPRATQTVMELAPRSPSGWSFDYEVVYLFGDPDAEPDADWAYRPPFAPAKEYLISQAYPDQITHTTPDSRHAVDIVMPENSGVYAARGGTVIAVTHKNFRGGADWGKYGGDANVVQILHSDGTIAVYAHLSWDSIRVRPGQEVVTGEFIAASGNTGFSTGPHLHFVVLRNRGMKIDSVPVRFSQGQGKVVKPRTRAMLQNP